MTHQVANETTVVVDALRSSTIGNTSGLDDRCVVTHVVDHSNKAVIQDVKGLPQDGVECCNGRTNQALNTRRKGEDPVFT